MVLNRSDGHKIEPKLQVQPNIGLDSDARRSVVELLTPNLADEAVLTLKTSVALLNIHGSVFSEMYTMFGSQYQLLNNNTNDIAERIRMLDGFAVGCFGDFLQCTRLVEHPGSAPNTLHLLADHETLIRFLREDIRKCAEEFEDAGTADLLVGILVIHEKMAWVLRSNIAAGTSSHFGWGRSPCTKGYESIKIETKPFTTENI